jgi:hypothetical protein
LLVVGYVYVKFCVGLQFSSVDTRLSSASVHKGLRDSVSFPKPEIFCPLNFNCSYMCVLYLIMILIYISLMTKVLVSFCMFIGHSDILSFMKCL